MDCPEMGLELRAARLALGMTQTELARALGLSRVRVSQLENGPEDQRLRDVLQRNNMRALEEFFEAR